jgi:ATP-binding cassette subfamily C protein CydC
MSTVFRLLRFLGGHRRRVARTVLLGWWTIAANVGLLAVSAYLVADAALRPSLLTLWFPIYLVQFFGVSRACFRYGERLVSHRLTFDLLADVRAWFYGRLIPLAPARLLAYRSGDLLTRLAADIQELENLYLRGVAPLVVAVVVTASVASIFAAFNVALALDALCCLLLAGLGVPLLARALARRAGRVHPALRAALTTQLVDGIQGMPDLIAFGLAAQQRERLAVQERALGATRRRMACVDGLRQALSIVTANLALVAILALATPLVIAGRIPGVYLAGLALLLLGSFEVVQPLGQAFQYLERSLAAGDRLFEVADAPAAITDSLTPLPRPAGIPTLTFDQVHFTYDALCPCTLLPALQDVSFELAPGRRVAIVGPSGSGKSTLARLALRAWDPSGGAIRLDGVPLARYTLDDVRRLFAVVAQDTYIFTDTLRNNVLLARPDASEAELARVVAAAQLTELVARLPRGLDSALGEQGQQIAGGERQRVALARALLKDAPILLLDEATANLDPLTEYALLDTIHDLLCGRSLLLISHRLVTMDRMDEILVLDQGRIVERGTHATLLAARGLYHQLFEAQNQILSIGPGFVDQPLKSQQVIGSMR